MEYLIKCPELVGPKHQMAKMAVERGKVISATPSFAWAVGEGIHVVLSHCAKRKIKWERLRAKPVGQMEFSL